jgi:hypothetical protein
LKTYRMSLTNRKFQTNSKSLTNRKFDQ